jgi:predicted GNAT family N-acyltransferase
MDIQVQYADSEAERAKIFRLRYDIYVKEMNYLAGVVDSENKLLTDPYDETARLLYATVGDEVAGTLRIHWGADAPFPPEFYETYDLARFEPVVPAEKMMIFTRFMVRKQYRGTMLPFQLLTAVAESSLSKKAQLSFCDCRPHLLNLYLNLGFRTYAKTYNDAALGLMVPLVLVIDDLEHLKRVNSPLLAFGLNTGPDSDVPSKVAPLIPHSSATESVTDDTVAKWARAYGLLTESRENENVIFDGIADDDVAQLMKRSHIIECQNNDRIIGKGSVDRTVFIILSGLVEVREADQVVAVLSKGDVIGELAFLLHAERLSDVYAASDDVRILSLNEKVLLGLFDSEPRVAARLLYNLSKVISTKMVSLYRQTYA